MKIEAKYTLGQLVVVKSYPKTNPLIGDPLGVPPIMLVIGVEIENTRKKTHDTSIGEQIAERIKYEVVWFESKKSSFVSKWVYESFLKEHNSEITGFKKYSFGGIAKFKPTLEEVKKKKLTTSVIKVEGQPDKKNETVYSLLSFVCPDLVMTGIRQNDEKSSFDDFGNKKSVKSQSLVKVMWYNHSQQKYSEYELPLEALAGTEKKIVEKE